MNIRLRRRARLPTSLLFRLISVLDFNPLNMELQGGDAFIPPPILQTDATPPKPDVGGVKQNIL
jgi:hypothetical protein